VPPAKPAAAPARPPPTPSLDDERKLGGSGAEGRRGEIAERELIEAWLEGCDLVRYGGFVPSLLQAKTALGDARGIVLATTEAKAA
jgi:hypothetical protein